MNEVIEAVKAGGSDIVMVAVATHNRESVTVAVKVPAGKPVAVVSVCEPRSSH